MKAIVVSLALLLMAPVADCQDVTQAFPGSMQVELYLPRSMSEEDAAYLGWISGGSSKEAGFVDRWVRSTASADAAWGTELLGPLRQPASEYAARSLEIKDYGERARMLKDLVKRRDELVARLFERERTSLHDALASSDVDEAVRGEMAERVMLARCGDAFVPDPIIASPMAANILRLLHDAAADPRTGPESATSVRKLALDHLPRVSEQRRLVMDATVKSGYRAYEARQRAINSGETSRGSGANAFRPVAAASAQVAATNHELAALARAALPPEVAKQLDDRLLRLTYGALAADFFSFEPLVAMIEPMVPEQDRAAVAELCMESTRRRVAQRDRMLREFDVVRRRFVEGGLVRDRETCDRFIRLLRDGLHASRSEALQAIGRIADLARSHPSWSERAFEEARNAWVSESRRRLEEVSTTGIASSVISPPQMEDLVREVCGS